MFNACVVCKIYQILSPAARNKISASDQTSDLNMAALENRAPQIRLPPISL
jgi:hypothetical protein